MQSLLDPPILFFLLGLLAGALRARLEVPPQIAKFLSLYLLMALGLKGGFALAESGLQAEMLGSLGAALLLSAGVPLLGYALLRRVVSGFDAAAIAAAYGSVSAVGFVTMLQHLEGIGTPASGHMVVAMVLMESPAILVAVLIAHRLRRQQPSSGHAPPALSAILREAFTDGPLVLLLGAMGVGLLSGEPGRIVMQPFSGDLFKGMLAFFLLDMGLLVARQFGSARNSPPLLLAYAIAGPLVHAALALGLAWLLGLGAADGAVLMLLAASASYIVVPAALREAIPEANPALYLGLSLGISFPFNLVAGIPLYTGLAQRLLGQSGP